RTTGEVQDASIVVVPDGAAAVRSTACHPPEDVGCQLPLTSVGIGVLPTVLRAVSCGCAAADAGIASPTARLATAATMRVNIPRVTKAVPSSTTGHQLAYVTFRDKSPSCFQRPGRPEVTRLNCPAARPLHAHPARRGPKMCH